MGDWLRDRIVFYSILAAGQELAVIRLNKDRCFHQVAMDSNNHWCLAEKLTEKL